MFFGGDPDNMGRKSIKYMENLVLRAIHRQALFRGDDRIAAAVSGGKDSTLMLYFLAQLRERFKGGFTLEAFRVIDEGSPCWNTSEINEFKTWCTELEVPLHLISAKPDTPVNGRELSKCFRCAWRRRRALFTHAHERGFRVLSLGHSAFDLCVTAVMNLMLHGNLETMPIRMEFFQGAMTVIRPISMLTEPDILDAVKRLSLPEPPPACKDSVGVTRRQYEQMVRELSRKNRQIIPNILKAAKPWH
jgi:tRNA 2-thiocytidine biosynthesis protein TtcA